MYRLITKGLKKTPCSEGMAGCLEANKNYDIMEV